MPRQTLPVTNAPGPYTQQGALVTLVAADPANDEQFVATGREMVVAFNVGGTAGTVTINSTADPYGRTGDIASFSIPAGGLAVFGPFVLNGWQQNSGHIFLEASSVSIKFGVIRVP